MRFLSNNYTADYRNVPEIMNNIRGIVDKDTCDDVERNFTSGCPNKSSGHISHRNCMDYKNYGNHKSVLKKTDLIKKSLNKEDKLNHAMPFPCWIARLCPNIFLISNGIIIKPGGNDRLTWDGSIILNWDSQPIKHVTNTEDEPTINYGTAWNRHLEQIWNMRISYPTQDILLWGDDVTGAFKHSKFNPEVIGDLGYILLQLLIIHFGLQLGCIFSPTNFVPLADAREQFAEFLGDDIILVTTQKEFLNRVKFSPEPDESVAFIQAVA